MLTMLPFELKIKHAIFDLNKDSALALMALEPSSFKLIGIY
jgi:hypothetical protein